MPKFWYPSEESTAAVCRMAKSARHVIDIGGDGKSNFPLAHETLGWEGDRKIDLDVDRLPYEDGSIDFVYSRHTIEDLSNPEHILREMRRVGTAGYICTPSPQAEVTRGIDASGTHMGYCHHRWIVWSRDGVLYLLPKYPIIERFPIPDQWPKLRNNRDAWQTQHHWKGPLSFCILKHFAHFNLGRLDERGMPIEYLELINMALGLD